MEKTMVRNVKIVYRDMVKYDIILSNGDGYNVKWSRKGRDSWRIDIFVPESLILKYWAKNRNG